MVVSLYIALIQRYPQLKTKSSSIAIISPYKAQAKPQLPWLQIFMLWFFASLVMKFQVQAEKFTKQYASQEDFPLIRR